MTSTEPPRDPAALRKAVAAHASPSWGHALRQLADSLLPFVLVLIAAYSLWPAHPVWALLLAAVAGAISVRVFILFHDCTHGAFVPSRRGNSVIGNLLAPLVYTPFLRWRYEHNRHHAGTGDLDRRGFGDIDTLTVAEYMALPWYGRLGYRLYRNPVVLFAIGPLYIFLFRHRLPRKGATRSERRNVHLCSLVLVVILGLLVWTQGWLATLLIQGTAVAVGDAIGVWLFYVQHQYEDAYWHHHADWDPTQAALAGSSFYRLPQPLRWLSGNIGYHHVHHLCAQVPNYRLRACHEAVAECRAVPVMTLASSLRSLRLRLWDDQQGRMIGWRELAAARARQHTATQDTPTR